MPQYAHVRKYHFLHNSDHATGSCTDCPAFHEHNNPHVVLTALQTQNTITSDVINMYIIYIVGFITVFIWNHTPFLKLCVMMLILQIYEYQWMMARIKLSNLIQWSIGEGDSSFNVFTELAFSSPKPKKKDLRWRHHFSNNWKILIYPLCFLFPSIYN